MEQLSIIINSQLSKFCLITLLIVSEIVLDLLYVGRIIDKNGLDKFIFLLKLLSSF